MREVSVFCDESGGENGHSRYCIIALVFHEQGEGFDDALVRYRRALRDASLEDVPFHASPLMYGKSDYAGMSLEDRKGLFMSFFILQKALPYRFKVFSYRRSEVPEPEKFTARFQKDLAVFLEQNLSFFQDFDKVKIYYDGGQDMVTRALHDALDRELSKEAVVYKAARAQEYVFFQVADFLCAMELAALKFAAHEITATDEKFFGASLSKFKKLYLRQVRSKEL